MKETKNKIIKIVSKIGPESSGCRPNWGPTHGLTAWPGCGNWPIPPSVGPHTVWPMASDRGIRGVWLGWVWLGINPNRHSPPHSCLSSALTSVPLPLTPCHHRLIPPQQHGSPTLLPSPPFHHRLDPLPHSIRYSRPAWEVPSPRSVIGWLGLGCGGRGTTWRWWWRRPHCGSGHGWPRLRFPCPRSRR
jgi:hypothetical protein